MLCGELAPDGGAVRLDGRLLAHWDAAELAAVRGVLSQSTVLAFPFTVYEVVALGARSSGRRLDAAARRRLPMRMLARVGLEACADRFYSTLSGGEQQRVQLARVLCQVPEPRSLGQAHWLFLDEPTANLDIRHQIAILQLAHDFAREGGGVLAVLHDLNLAALYADRLIVVSEGRIAADGAPAAVLDDRLMASVFAAPLKVNVAPRDGTPFVLPHSIV